MMTFKQLKKIIYISIIIYISLIIYSIIKSIVSPSDIIKASIIGLSVGLVNIINEVFFKEDIVKGLHKIKYHIERLKK